MKSLSLTLFADYHQFYLQDEAVTGDLSDVWSDEAVERLLAVAPGTIGVGTVRNMEVPVVVELHEQMPADDRADWDHVVDCGILVGSGRIVIAGCTDYFPDAARLDAPPGEYRARASYGALDTLSEDGLDGQDRYRVQLWPGSLIPPVVVKQRGA